MIGELELGNCVGKEEYTKEIDDLRGQLSALQHKIKSAKKALLIVFEGWGASGKGSIIGEIILNLDPRLFKVHSFESPLQHELRYPSMRRYWNKLPEYGSMAIFDRSWYRDVTVDRIEKHNQNRETKEIFNEINVFERQIKDDGYTLVKFFLHITKKEQKKRFEKLVDNDKTAWRVTKVDRERHKNYEEYFLSFDQMIKNTNEIIPWNIIDAKDKRYAIIEVYKALINAMNTALESQKTEDLDSIVINNNFNLVQMPALSEIDLNKSIQLTEYRSILKDEQKKLKELHNVIYQHKIPIVIAYEGWDAAGKGGNIKRVAAALDPRGYEVTPIASPSLTEKAHHYLWRFWGQLPKTGHIGIFDRSWYGRLMVERLEGFCSGADWKRAFNEVNEFEKSLYDAGAIVVKFWIHIDKDEQLKRFKARQSTPEKQWKLTDEDWRNREKWDLYEAAVNDMIKYTSTDFAPWTIIESNDKRFARIKAIRTIINAIEDRLKETQIQDSLF